MYKPILSFRSLVNFAHQNLKISQNYLHDSYGRNHDYLRISLTEKCNLRCTYCMPDEGMKLGSRESYLRVDELKRLSQVFVQLCRVKKIRLTGGEPTMDKKLLPMLEYLNHLRVYGLEKVALTTNGLTLSRQCQVFKDLGLNMINISLDTLKADRFELITRRRGWDLVYKGLLSAIETKFDSVKLNCVVRKGFNDDEILDFVALAQSYPIEVRFIEFMPFAGNKWQEKQMISYNQMLMNVMEKYPDLKRVVQSKNEVSKVYKSRSMIGSVGFISSMSDNFCSGCNRLRLTSDGYLKVCLFGNEETSLRDLIRNGATDAEILKTIEMSLSFKRKQNAGANVLKKETLRPMIRIGSRMYHTTRVLKKDFTHLDSEGIARMVNVGPKSIVKRVALAQGKIYVGSDIIAMILNQTVKKGDVISVSRIAGIMGAKKTSSLIPLCHQIPLDLIRVDIKVNTEQGFLLVEARAETTYKTGVEIESLMAVSVTLLTVYDMCKSISKRMKITDIELLSKTKE